MVASRIFLTGASGNVGQAVLTELLQRGYDVSALVRFKLPDAKGYRPIFGDLTKIYNIRAEVSAAKAIIHCASPRAYDRQAVMSGDIETTAQLLDAWRDGPFVFASSQTVYGIPNAIVDEKSPINAGSWYDMGKICNEHQVAMAAEETKAGPGISLRLPLVFAAGPRRRDRQFLPAIWDAIRAGKPFLFGSEEAIESCGSVFIGEKDIGRAFCDALTNTASGAYNFAGGFCTWKELLETMGRHGGFHPKYVVRQGAVATAGEHRMPQSRTLYDCTLFTRATGFEPRQSLDEVIHNFIRAEQA